MSYHVRRQIRDAIATAITGLATSGARVYVNRVYPGDPTRLGGPYLLVNTDGEKIEAGSQAVLERTLNVSIRAVAKGATSDDTLDLMCAEVETALAGKTLSKLCAPLVLESIEIDLDDALEQAVGMAIMTWRAVYFTACAAPTVAL